MSQLKLYGMKAAYDEIITTAVKRQHEPQQIVGDLLNAEISEKQARSIKYQMTIAKLPLAKEVDEFSFEETPVNETLVRALAAGEFLERCRAHGLLVGKGGLYGNVIRIAPMLNVTEDEMADGIAAMLAAVDDINQNR